MFFNRLQQVQESQSAPQAPAAAFMVLPTAVSGGGFDAVQMLYQRAFEAAQTAQTPAVHREFVQRELFSVMN